MSRIGVALTVALSLPMAAFTQRLPLKTYTTADGLASNSIRWIVPDSRGFLWFCTQEGLSRFDGSQFTTYGREHGLPDVDVYDLLETRRGDYWIATASGVCRLRPSSRQGNGQFEVYRPKGNKSPPAMTSLFEDPDGSIWCGSDDGVFRMVEHGGRWEMVRLDLGNPSRTSAEAEVNAFLRDRHGTLWIAAFSGLYTRTSDGRIHRFTGTHGLPVRYAYGLLQDSRGRLWVGTGAGLCRLKADPRAGQKIVDRIYTTKDGLPGNYIRSLLEAADGSLWIGTLSGLARSDWIRNPDAALETYSTAHGLTSADAHPLKQDRDGNIWVGSDSGVTRIAGTGFVTFAQAAGLHSSNVVSIFEDREGKLCAVTLTGRRQVVHRFDAGRFTASKLALTDSEHLVGRSTSQIALQDRAGQWWFANGPGILRLPSMPFDRLSHRPPRDNIPNFAAPGVGFRVYQDSRGDIWTSYSSWARHGLQRWERATGKLQSFSEKDGLPSMGTFLPRVFAEDHDGSVWVGSDTGLARYRSGRFQHFGSSPGRVRSLHVDSAGRLWAGWGSRGVVRIDDPAAREPDFGRSYAREQGLSGDIVHSIAEDREGRIYLGLSGGVDRIDPAQPMGAGLVDHFTEGSGLAAGRVQAAYRDRSGALWFGTPSGLSRIVPDSRPAQPPPPVFITGLRSGNQRLPVSELGEQRVSGLRFQPDQRQIEVGFVAPHTGTGETLHYQYKLASDPHWSATSQGTVNYANLAPGTYRFTVRAVTSRGVAGEPAVLEFEMLPPLWRRWWFLSIAAAFAAAAAAGAHRYRVSRLVEMERVRVRIATDLHDDIGSGISQLAILSEQVKRRLDGATPSAIEPLGRIATVSRELVDSMEDIVWSINPARDRVQDLSRRMRQFAGEVLEPRGIDFELHAPEECGDIALDPGARRQLYLIFKEAVHNLRHSGCSKAVATLELRDGALVLEVRDNGHGIQPAQSRGGHGLASMRARADRAGGKLEIDSSPAGASIRARIPLGRTFLRRKVGGGPGKVG